MSVNFNNISKNKNHINYSHSEKKLYNLINNKNNIINKKLCKTLTKINNINTNNNNKLNNNNNKNYISFDRFIPIKNDENFQNFLLHLKNSNSDNKKNNNNLNINSYFSNNSEQESEKKRYNKLILDSLIHYSDLSLDKNNNNNSFFSNNDDNNSILNNSNNTNHHINKNKFKSLLKFSTTNNKNNNNNNINIINNNNNSFNYFSNKNFLNNNFLFNFHTKNRHINQTPEKILDAPSLLDNFYINVLDYSKFNILSVALSNEVYLYNTENFCIEKLPIINNNNNNSNSNNDNEIPISSLKFMNDIAALAIGYYSGFIEIWDIVKNTKIRTLNGHDNRVGCLNWNEYILASGSKDSKIYNHDVRLKEHIIHKLLYHKQEICSLKYNYDGNLLASGGNDNMVYIYDIRKFCNNNSINNCNKNFNINNNNIRPLFSLSYHTAAIKALSWCPFIRNLLATGAGSKDKTIKFFSCDSNKMINSYYTGSQVCNILWNKKEKEIISSHGFSKNNIIIWKYPKMNKIADLKGHMKRVLYLSISPDENTIVSGAGDETIRFWKINEKIDENSRDNEDDFLNVNIR